MDESASDDASDAERGAHACNVVSPHRTRLGDKTPSTRGIALRDQEMNRCPFDHHKTNHTLPEARTEDDHSAPRSLPFGGSECDTPHTLTAQTLRTIVVHDRVRREALVLLELPHHLVDLVDLRLALQREKV